MSLSNVALQALNDHWAVAAISAEDRKRADDLMHQCLANQAVGEQVDFSFEVNAHDESLLERVALAFELAAIEGLDELGQPAGKCQDLRDQAIAASLRTFEILKHLSVPRDVHGRIFFVLKLSAVAYCGEHWSDLWHWYRQEEDTIKIPAITNNDWDQRLLYRLFDCWVQLFRKQGWGDLDSIAKIIADLRNEQALFESDCLNKGSKEQVWKIALRLAALYNWAKATETLAGYVLQGEPSEPLSILDKHFEAGIQAAAASGDAQHEMILRWLHATARIMVTNSPWWATRTVNSLTSEFVHSQTHR